MTRKPTPTRTARSAGSCAIAWFAVALVGATWVEGCSEDRASAPDARAGRSGSSSAGAQGGTLGSSGVVGAGGNPGDGSAGVGGSAGAGVGGSAGAGVGGSVGMGGSAGAGADGSVGAGGSGGRAPSFILGADISSVQEAVDRGARYVDTDGREKSMLDLLKNHGFNFVRLRTFVNPMAPYGYAGATTGCQRKAEAYCDKDHTIAFAQEVKAAGMGLLLDFHYSDTWADPGNQIIPEAWRSATTVADLAARLKAYTKDVVASLAGAGARPDMVQVGNEITAGMLVHLPDADTDCWGNGAATRSGGVTGSSSNANWGNLAALLTAGIQGVKEVDASIKVMVHIENTDELEGVRWWVSSARSRGVQFDVLGLSCYTAFQGTPSVWQSTLSAIASEFPELSFVVAEYNPEPRRVSEIMRGLPNGRGLGSFFWEPTQGGDWGRSMFTCESSVCRANAADFQVFDRIRQDFGL
jgi:arabinogalactan endo-1,4-beta-galactosidase